MFALERASVALNMRVKTSLEEFQILRVDPVQPPVRFLGSLLGRKSQDCAAARRKIDIIGEEIPLPKSIPSPFDCDSHSSFPSLQLGGTATDDHQAFDQGCQNSRVGRPPRQIGRCTRCQCPDRNFVVLRRITDQHDDRQLPATVEESLEG